MCCWWSFLGLLLFCIDFIVLLLGISSCLSWFCCCCYHWTNWKNKSFFVGVFFFNRQIAEFCVCAREIKWLKDGNNSNNNKMKLIIIIIIKCVRLFECLKCVCGLAYNELWTNTTILTCDSNWLKIESWNVIVFCLHFDTFWYSKFQQQHQQISNKLLHTKIEKLAHSDDAQIWILHKNDQKQEVERKKKHFTIFIHMSLCVQCFFLLFFFLECVCVQHLRKRCVCVRARAHKFDSIIYENKIKWIFVLTIWHCCYKWN